MKSMRGAFRALTHRDGTRITVQTQQERRWKIWLEALYNPKRKRSSTVITLLTCHNNPQQVVTGAQASKLLPLNRQTNLPIVKSSVGWTSCHVHVFRGMHGFFPYVCLQLKACWKNSETTSYCYFCSLTSANEQQRSFKETSSHHLAFCICDVELKRWRCNARQIEKLTCL